MLQGPTRSVQQVDAPEGNGTGFVWDDKGHVVSARRTAGKLARARSCLQRMLEAWGSSRPLPAMLACLGTLKRAQTHATAVATAPSVSAC